MFSTNKSRLCFNCHYNTTDAAAVNDPIVISSGSLTWDN